MLACAVIALGTTACSGSKSDDKPDGAGSSGSSTAPSAGSSASSSGPEEKLPDLNAAQVVSAFTGKGYKCSTDEAYQTCAQGTTSIQVLIGTQPRPPVISLQATGVAAEATTKLSDFAPQALELAHVNPRGQIADWLKQRQGKAGQTTAGNWTVEFSTEVDSDQPGAILTLTDKLCKVDCGAE
ncbi:hypothetical protein ACIA58_35020 [Kribbella sp. NPDC051586]|uniref:hypothetical protein n=1 Tax=Kribbella sp. NPDC051586 TaxID=3364118 RepID=UPI00378A147A